MIFSLFFLENRDLTFHANCLQWGQFAYVKSCFLGKTGDNLHEMSFLFSGKIKKNSSVCHLLKILPGVLNVKIWHCIQNEKKLGICQEKMSMKTTIFLCLELYLLSCDSSACLNWLPSNWYLNQQKNDSYFTKILSFGISFCLIWLVSYEFLTGKGNDMCRKIFKEYFTSIVLKK